MTPAPPLRDRLIPWYFVLFFVVLACVDGFMVSLALRTHSGMVTEHPYEKGLAYNRVVEAAATQQVLGWKGEIAFHEGVLTFQVRDAKGVMVALDEATARFTRPTQAGVDREVPLTRTATGTWQATPVLPLPGVWEARLYARQGEHHFQLAKRIVIP